MNHREYFNRMAKRWDYMVPEEVKARLPILINDLEIKPGDTILDVGGGTGILLPLLYKTAGDRSRIVTLDIAEEMLKLARNGGHRGNINYIHGDVASLPLVSEAFDIVICYSCFPHFPNKAKALVEMARVLKTSGRLVICHAASRQEINELHKSIGDIVGNDTIPDETTIRKMLKSSGLKKIEVRDEAQGYLAIATKVNSRPSS